MMKTRLLMAFLLLFTIGARAQPAVIPLYNGPAPGSEAWNYNEKATANGQIVYDVSHPTLTIFRADPSIANGTAMVVCPGGGFYILIANDEGGAVVKWLNQKGITVFLLKYRLAHSLTGNPLRELVVNMQKPNFSALIKPVIPFSIADGQAAIQYVRSHATEYGISPSRIGVLGFSAGGTVAASAAYNDQPENKPDFVGCIYPYMPSYLQGTIPADAPPMFIAAASDDQLGLVPNSLELYSKWQASKHPAELHIYTKGGHGFGLKKQGIPTDNWIDRFGDWLQQLGYLEPIDPAVAARIHGQETYSKRQEFLLHKDWPEIGRYQTENANVPPAAPGEKRVVFLGNSITDGWKNIDPSFFEGRPYYDRGIGGQTSGQMLLRFREDVINLKPAVVVIMAGINDIAENNGPSKLEDVFGNIVSMAEMAQLHHIKVVLSSVMPAFSFPWRPGIDPKPSVAALNGMIKDYCEKNNLVYLDYFTVMADQRKGLPANLSKDGVHPTLEGYKLMEPLAEKAIAEALGHN